MTILELLGQARWQPLAWTLLHFLWQGTIVAFGTAVLLYELPLRRATQRYTLCLAAMTIMAACPILTWCTIERGAVTDEVASARASDSETGSSLAASGIPQDSSESNVTENNATRLADPQRTLLEPTSDTSISTTATNLRVPEESSKYLRFVQPYCLLLWFTGVSLLTARLCFGWLQIQWLVSNTFDLPSDVAARAIALGNRLGLRSQPRLRLSDKVSEALVMKLWRPIVVLPTAWLTEMTPEILEAVIAHELAHVRRLDLWVSFAQRLVETILFYHPAVWWLSRRIDFEREICADDLAVEATTDRLVYATALEQLGRMRIDNAAPQLGVGIGTNRNALLQRIKNVLRLPIKRKRIRWWPMGLIVLAVIPALWGILLLSAVSPQLNAQSNQSETEAEADNEAQVETDLALEVRLLGIDGRPTEKCTIQIWRAVTAEDEISSENAAVARTLWRDPLANRTWRPAGRFATSNTAVAKKLRPGDYRVTGFLGHDQPSTFAVSDVIRLDGSRQRTKVDISIENGPALAIDVVDANNGARLEGTRLRLVRANGLPLERWSRREGQDELADFEHLAPGNYRLEATKNARRHGEKAFRLENGPLQVKVSAGQDQRLIVRLTGRELEEEEVRRRWPWCVIGTITNAQGQPLENVKVRASCGAGTLMPTGSTTTDEQGRYTLRFGPGMRSFDEKTGTWRAGLQAATIFASKDGYTEQNLCRQGGLLMADEPPAKDNAWGAKISETILPNQPFQVDYVMVPAIAFEAKLVDENGAPIVAKRISIQGTELPPSSSVLAGGKTDQQGVVRFSGVPASYAWWLSVDGSGRTQPLTFSRPGTYQVVLQSIHHQRHDLHTVRTTSVISPDDVEVREQVVGDDPAARAPVSEELQQLGREYLTRMEQSCRDWLDVPPLGTEYKSLEYRFRLGDQAPETMRIVEGSKAGRTSRQGIHYTGTPHLLAKYRDKIVFRQVETDENEKTIRLRFIVPVLARVAAGNGITGKFRGFFSGPLREGTIILDQQTFRPLKTDWETFSNYIAIEDGRFAPQRIQIRRDSTKWNWTFRVYEQGVWLLEQSSAAGESSDAIPWLTIDQVKVDGQPAIPIDGQKAAADDAQAAGDVAKRWLSLIKQDKRDEAAKLMVRGKNENADDGLSMTVLLEAAKQTQLSIDKVHANPDRALASTTTLTTGEYKGRSFLFHLTFNWMRQGRWQIHETSLVKQDELNAQVDSFTSPVVNTPVDARGFGPEIARALNLTRSHSQVIDLDTNRIIEVPHDFGNNREFTQDPLKWIVVRGVDLGPHRGPNNKIELRGIFLPRLLRVGNGAWEQLAAKQIEAILPAPQPGMPRPAHLEFNDSFPVTYAFETITEPRGHSHQGILQVLSAGQDMIEIRYKLVGRTNVEAR